VTIPVAQVAPSVQTPTPVLSTTAVVGGAVVTIQSKKNVPTAPPAILAKGGARIIPTKKRVSAAAITVKKPRLVVPLAANSTITPPVNETVTAKVGASPPQKSQKRRFTERKISIEMKSAKATRKYRRNLKHKIETMPITSVRKILLRKGVLKPTKDGKMPPEDMMRSMLKDYLLLHAAE
jgi:hypothetical protein